MAARLIVCDSIQLFPFWSFDRISYDKRSNSWYLQFSFWFVQTLGFNCFLVWWFRHEYWLHTFGLQLKLGYSIWVSIEILSYFNVVSSQKVFNVWGPFARSWHSNPTGAVGRYVHFVMLPTSFWLAAIGLTIWLAQLRCDYALLISCAILYLLISLWGWNFPSEIIWLKKLQITRLLSREPMNSDNCYSCIQLGLGISVTVRPAAQA